MPADAWGRRLIDRAVGPQDERGYLLHARGQTAGALAFSTGRDTPPSPAHSTTPATFAYTLALHARVDAGAKLSAIESEQLLGEAGSGGARPKLTLEEDGALWLVKGVSVDDSPEYAPVPCIEAALLTLARACDIRVPRHDVRRIAGDPVLLVERFDRYRLSDGTFGRWRYASAQTLFWSQPDSARYSYQGSYTNLAGTCGSGNATRSMTSASFFVASFSMHWSVTPTTTTRTTVWSRMQLVISCWPRRST